MSTIPGNPVEQTTEKPKGFFLKYRDFKSLERILEEYNLDDKGEVNFNTMSPDVKEILWKIKTIIRNMESVRLRNNDKNPEQASDYNRDHEG